MLNNVYVYVLHMFNLMENKDAPACVCQATIRRIRDKETVVYCIED